MPSEKDQPTSSRMVIKGHIGPNGELISDTTTKETISTDAKGNTHTTREIKSGKMAGQAADSMIGHMFGKIGMGGFGQFLNDMLAPPQPDPIEELARLGFGGGWHQPQTAEQVIRLRNDMRDDPHHPGHMLKHNHQQFLRQQHRPKSFIDQILDDILGPMTHHTHGPHVHVMEMAPPQMIPMHLIGAPLPTHIHVKKQGNAKGLPKPECSHPKDVNCIC